MYQSLYFCFVSLKTHKFTATWGQIVSSAHKIAFWSAPCINVWPWYAVWILFLSRVTTGFLTDRRTWAQESASQRHKDVSSLCGVSFVFFLQHWLSYSCVLSAVFYLLHAFMMSSSLVFMRKTFAFVSKKKNSPTWQEEVSTWNRGLPSVLTEMLHYHPDHRTNEPPTRQNSQFEITSFFNTSC